MQRKPHPSARGLASTGRPEDLHGPPRRSEEESQPQLGRRSGVDAPQPHQPRQRLAWTMDLRAAPDQLGSPTPERFLHSDESRLTPVSPLVRRKGPAAPSPDPAHHHGEALFGRYLQNTRKTLEMLQVVLERSDQLRSWLSFSPVSPSHDALPRLVSPREVLASWLRGSGHQPKRWTTHRQSAQAPPHR